MEKPALLNANNCSEFFDGDDTELDEMDMSAPIPARSPKKGNITYLH